MVRPTGPLNCKIAFVGEAPGEREVQEGKPFVGYSGRLLDQLLHQRGILRTECYITNVVKERPPGNDIKRFIDLGRKVKVTERYLRYEEQLYEELRECKANVLVALGKVPLYALTRRVGIMKYRGSILESVPELGGRKVIPTIHPAAALREYTFVHFIGHDFKKVKDESSGPEIVLPQRDLVVCPSFVEIEQYVETCRRKGLVAFDIETQNGAVNCISLSHSPDSSMSIPFFWGPSDYFPPNQEAEVWLMLAKLLEDPGVVKVAQNANYDVTYLYHLYGIVTHPVEDTMVAHKMMYPDFPAGLDFMTSTLTREPYYKDEGKEVMRGVSKDKIQFWTYNAKDSAVTLEIWLQLREVLNRNGMMDAYRRQVSLIPILVYMQEHGLLVDRERLKQLSEETGDRLSKLRKRFRDVAGDVNPNSPAQLKELFYGRLGYKPRYKRVKGQDERRVATDVDALKELEKEGSEEAKLLREIRKDSKMKSTYLDVDLDADGRLRCFYNPVGTVTGRLSSRQSLWGTGTNLQNQPPLMRTAILADPGYLLVEQDLSQAENRIVAWLADEKAMKKAFLEGQDIHRLTFGMMFGIPANEVSDEPGSSPLGNGQRSQRYWGKQFNHSFNYDLGPRSFAQKVEIDLRTSKMLVESYHMVYPAIRGKFHVWVRNQLSKDLTVQNCYGRKRLFLGRWGDDMFKQAYAQPAQSTVADKINQDGLLYIWEHYEDKFRGLQLLNQVHDSILYQVPMDDPVHAANMVRSVKESLEKPVPWTEPFVIPVDTAVGLSWGNKVKVKDITPEALERVYKEQLEMRDGTKTA